MYKPESVIENETYKILCYFEIKVGPPTSAIWYKHQPEATTEAKEATIMKLSELMEK